MNETELTRIEKALRSKPTSPTVTLPDRDLRELYYLTLRPVPSQFCEQVVKWILFDCKTFRPTTDAIKDFCDRIEGRTTEDNDGHPGVEEAWAMLVWDEQSTCVWTKQMMGAWDLARNLYETDKVAARMTFKEVYNRLVAEARSVHEKADWEISLGWDKAGRAHPVVNAVEKGLISARYAHRALPEFIDPEGKRIPAHVRQRPLFGNAPSDVQKQIEKLHNSTKMTKDAGV